jgi:hypothetical protein
MNRRASASVNATPTTVGRLSRMKGLPDRHVSRVSSWRLTPPDPQMLKRSGAQRPADLQRSLSFLIGSSTQAMSELGAQC